jgi:branched-chain amino acid transport system substrate-binding protein
MRRLPRALVFAAFLSALGLSGCLGSDEPPSRVRGDTVVIYSSLPATGVSAPAARAVAAGERLALERAGGRVGRLSVRLVELDAARAGEGPWSPERVNANAERAASDPKAIAYLGELAYGASAVSLPTTNDARLLQVSPTDTLTSLTQTPPGRPRAGPERYYPSGKRSFARLVPNDRELAERLLELAAAGGARRMAVLFDGDIYSRELAGQLVSLGRRDGPQPVHSEEYRGRLDEIPDVVRRLDEATPDVVAYAGIAQRGTGRLLAQIDRRLPAVPVYATSGLLDQGAGGVIAPPPAVVRALGPVAPVEVLSPAARRLSQRLALPGESLARPEALYGYEAMRVVLDAIRAGGRDRERVRRAGLRIRTRRSPLGSYGLRASGDVDSERFALWALRDGHFDFVRMVE